MNIYTGKAQLEFATGKITVFHPEVRKESVILLTGEAQSVDFPCVNNYSVTDIGPGQFTILTDHVGDTSTIHWLVTNTDI